VDRQADPHPNNTRSSNSTHPPVLSPPSGSISRVDITHSMQIQENNLYKYKNTFNKKQEIRTKMTDRQNTYNFSHTQPKQTRPKLFDTQHRGQYDTHKRHPRFNREHHAPISFKSTSRPLPRAPSKNDEVKKATRGGILNKSTNQNVLIQAKQKPRQNDFTTNQDFSNTARQSRQIQDRRRT
jgi:hypothetical protein